MGCLNEEEEKRNGEDTERTSRWSECEATAGKAGAKGKEISWSQLQDRLREL